ncbi:uncharacterized protein LOC133848626 isoform X3 [Drosophila sulfurigaster albostrigata]|uniref:uncharacterized protein LOC133848626 isoform X3 n=2 Tax=Drosophila sulfurigaster albostrigata TaxID=89887 RepID=UPI002D21A8D2|nr:uncharacterized protein LOC133848626 isoform X3 [Drosophila sulfurigaster albostrigata]
MENDILADVELQEFLALERKQLEQERQRLNAVNNQSRSNNFNNAQSTCPAALLLQKDNFVAVQCQRMANGCNEPSSATATSPALATQNQNYVELQLQLDELKDDNKDENENGKQEATSITLLKSAKEFVNQRELLVGSARQYKSPNASSLHRQLESERPQSENRLPIGRSDDMEQWVTDTFYSYFPGFNNENQKRQNYLRERQRENQQNFLKHQMLHPPAPKQRRQVKLSQPEELQTSRSNHSTSTSSTSNSRTDKTDLELIVNSNPNYVPPKKRPGTTRQQLLQDLGHVELSNIVTGDGILERNMRSAELETARKRDYQRDLMQQIEEKRRSIEILREKERRQEEALTRRLEAQLKTIHLQEQLEKQRQRAEKARKDSDHNRLMREQLLAKLEEDAQLLHAKEHNDLAGPVRNGNAKADNKDINGNANKSNTTNTNKVYKYFSNSARHEYRRGEPLPAGVELDFELPEMSKIERECFHLCEKICPLCDEPLKSYESCCLRCQRKLALKMKQRQPSDDTGGQQSDETTEAADAVDHDCQNSYALVCLKCERLYALCSQCLVKSDVCRACQRERNVCMNCRRNLCSFWLEEIACGRDTERTHVNEVNEEKQQKSDDAFRVLELNYAVPSPTAETSAANPTEADSPPYSFNISPNSVFHADYKPTPVKPLLIDQLPVATSSANNSFELDSADEQAMERVRRQTDKRLSRYLKNYGDLASKHQQDVRSNSESRHRGTQTMPQSLGRRDVVLLEPPTHNLSMPLLREMPKMTRKETGALPAESTQRKMDNLKKRWEVPAVQKFTVSSTSPKILTQVGAIRKQLQAARFFDDAQDEVDGDDDY